MKLCFSTLTCPDWTIEQIVANAVSFGFQGVELSARHKSANFTPTLRGAERRLLKDRFEGSGIEVVMVNAYNHFITEDKEEREKSIQMVKDFVVLASDIGSTAVRVFGQRKGEIELPSDMLKERCLELVADSISDVAAFALGYGVNIFLETHDAFCEPEHVPEVMKNIDYSNVGVIWDVTNSMRTGKSVHQAFASVKDYVKIVHVKDYRNVRTMSGPCLIGNGENPCKEALGLLKENDFGGYFSVETEKQYHPEPDVPGPDVSLIQFIKKMKEYWG